MLYILHSKFEAAIYNDKEKKFFGGSYQIKLSFNRILSKDEQKIFNELVDLFDHSTVSNYSSSLNNFIRKNSARYVQTDIEIDESIYSKLIFITITEYIKTHKLDNLTLLSVESFNGKDQTVIIIAEDVTLYSTKNYQISKETFNS